jgi:hypothetical protein
MSEDDSFDSFEEEMENRLRVTEKFQDMVQKILDSYKKLVLNTHPKEIDFWPILSGYDVSLRTFRKWLILILEHTGKLGYLNFAMLDEFSPQSIGVTTIEEDNINSVRSRMETQLKLKGTDFVLFMGPNRGIDSELRIMLQKHEVAMGLAPMKVFLSHRNPDKPLVRDFKETLLALGFEPWIDEDALRAGAELERGILKGLKDSCAAVFFITPNFVDEHYLATEIDYAIAEKRAKGDRFAIITLVFGENIQIPDLLKRYVWKKPATHLEAIRDILKALPIQVGNIYWRT